MSNTLYDDLGLLPDCTPAEIKQQYRILAHQHHPDRGGDEETFKRIKLAYEILIDPIKRAHYDSTGENYSEANVDNEVMTRLSNMIAQFSQQINPEFDDLILSMKVDIQQAQHQTHNAIINCNNTIQKLNIVAEKIKLKKPGENLLRSFVETKIKNHYNELAAHQITLIIFKKMLDILEEYHFSLEEWKLLIEE
jgi:curved DNA-binding protein CbpA